MRGIRKQMRRFKGRIKNASLPQLRKILVVLAERLNSVNSIFSKKRIKSKIIITQMAIRNKMGTSNSLGGGQIIGGAAEWSNQTGKSMQQAPPQTPGITSNFVNNMNNGYQRFGCKFLCSRLYIQKNLLVGFQTSGTQPNWAQNVQNKYNYIASLIQKYKCDCNQFDFELDCKRMKPYCNPLRNLFKNGNTAAANGIIQSIASQYNISDAVVQSTYKKCCAEEDDGNSGDGRIDCERIKPYCEKITSLIANNQTQALQTLMNNIAQQFGVTYAEVKTAYYKCCEPNVGGGDRRYSCDKKTGNCYADPNGIYATIADCKKNCRPDRGGDRRMKDCYDCNRKGGVVMNRIPFNQSCPRGWQTSPVINGTSRNPCKRRGTGGLSTPPTKGEMNNFSGMWFNDEY